MEGPVTAPDPLPRSRRPLGRYARGRRAWRSRRRAMAGPRRARTKYPDSAGSPNADAIAWASAAASRSIWIVRDLFRRTMARAAASKSSRRSSI
jgi:hypothetical protein